MTEEKKTQIGRRPPRKRKNKCRSKFNQFIRVDFEVVFAVDIPACNILNVQCIDRG